VPKDRRTLSEGEFKSERSRDEKAMRNQFRQNIVVKEMIGLRLLDATRDEAIEQTAKTFSKGRGTLLELYRVNVEGLIGEVAQEMVLMKKISLERARVRVDEILTELDTNRARQKKT
jgi:hypothetical protein